MRVVPSAGDPLDLIDLKFLPAWVKEDWSAPRRPEWEEEQEPSARRDERTRERSARAPRHEQKFRDRRSRRPRDDRGRPDRRDRKHSRDSRPARQGPPLPPLPQLDVHFLPRTAAFENVAAQIKAGTVAYSVYSLARLFLQKPERYHAKLKTKDATPLFVERESKAISTDRRALENSAFRLVRDKFYTANVSLTEPIKGDFNSVARERTTGILLGPTNYHAYQPQLRRLYEQRFSRRMSFTDFQRQIENVSDPALVAQWKEDARKVTTFVTREEEPAQTFNTEAEAERHFREKYLPTLISETAEAEIDGVTSRRLPDRGIARVIENAWSTEVRSPASMMQELAGRFRGSGLQIFRHRKGMLFVSPIRTKPIDESAVSDSVRRILETLKALPRINRKELAEKLIPPGTAPAEAETMKLGLASDLHWMIREGHVIEFNDGSLDLPRAKPRKTEGAAPGAGATEAAAAEPVQAGASDAEKSDTSAIVEAETSSPGVTAPTEEKFSAAARSSTVEGPEGEAGS